MTPATTAGPLPKFPKKTEIPIFKTTSTELPNKLAIPSALSFYYAGISSIWLWYKAPMETLRAYLEPLGMTPYDFGGGQGAVNINFFNAVAFYGQGQPGNQGVGGFNETEVNIAAFATKVGANVPQGLSLEQYLTSGDPTKRIGNYRVWVACDDAVAVACGIQIFMENKFLVSYDYNVPGANNPRPAPDQFTYDWTCHDTEKTPQTIYQVTLNLTGLSPVLGNMSEVIDLSFDKASRRPVGSRRNYLGMFDTYLQPAVSKSVKLTYGKSDHPMRHDMERLLGDRHPAALQLYKSPTCIAEAAGYYADL
ncbi:MAG: hypothetical protein ABIP93_20230 [Gemmatimonadaceae bacterium]